MESSRRGVAEVREGHRSAAVRGKLSAWNFMSFDTDWRLTNRMRDI